MKILITGASGFIGKSLLKNLLNRGFDVIAPVRNMEMIPDHDQLTKIKIVNLEDNINWKTMLVDVDVVIHLASRVHIMNDNADDSLAAYRKMNVDVTINLAGNALSAGIKKFIFLSSIKVNGEVTRQGMPFRHSEVPHPKDAYAISKYEAELALFELVKNTHMGLIIIRPPLVYGPGVKANFLKILTLLNKGMYLPFASIKNKRSLIYLDNLVDLIIISALKPVSGSHIFLASDGHDLSTSELLNIMASSLPHASRLLPFPVSLLRLILFLIGKKSIAQRLFDSLQVDITHTVDVLDWKPPVSIKQALHETVESFLKD